MGCSPKPWSSQDLRDSFIYHLLLPYKSGPVELDDVITPLLISQQKESPIELDAIHHDRKWNKDNSKRQFQNAPGRGQLGSEVTQWGKDAECSRAWMQLTPGPQVTLESFDVLMEILSPPTWGSLLENEQNRRSDILPPCTGAGSTFRSSWGLVVLT